MKKLLKLFLSLGFVSTVSSVGAAVLHVRADTSGPEPDGLSWATAFESITAAQRHATSGDELWVAAGTYRGPIRVPRGVSVYGGFAGNETSRSQRDWAPNKSVIDWSEWGEGAELFNERFGPAVSLTSGSRLDGFTVRNGWHSHGAAIYAADAGAISANNVIVANRATGLLESAVLVDRSGEFAVSNDFFLKTANDLLRLQFPFGVTNIPVAQYGPAVHRLLQVAANIHDAVHSNAFPSVFRPQYASSPDGPVVSGYYEDDSATNINQWLETNGLGLPIIIGMRKGWPSFNEVSVETTVLGSRRLELRRHDTNSMPYQTNEMYIVGVSNKIGVELWNSWTQAVNNDVKVTVSTRCSFLLADPTGVLGTASSGSSAFPNFVAGTWSGFSYAVTPNQPTNLASFKTFINSRQVIQNSGYRFSPASLQPINSAFVTGLGFRVPEWRLFLTYQSAAWVSSNDRIVDFVSLDNLTNMVKVSDYLFQSNPATVNEGVIANCWSTNRPGTSNLIPTEGIQTQLDISLGNPTISDAQWREFNFAQAPDVRAAIESFSHFVSGIGFNTNLVQIAPFSPTRKIVINGNWEANDPRIHSLAQNLKDTTNSFGLQHISPFGVVISTNHTLGTLNSRYRPWGGRPGQAPSADDFNFAVKDRGLWNADAFDFPAGTAVNVDWLDRIHRGTPWQTLYFDRDVAPMNVWMRQSLDPGTHPTNDWAIIEYLRGQLSYPGSPTPTRVVNNTIVGNEGGLWITANASASVMNNAVVDNTSGVFDEGSGGEFNRNCVFGNLTDNNAGDVSGPPQFVNPAGGDFALLATSPLIDAGNDVALGWTERPVFGAEVDVGALEFGPDGALVFTFQRTSGSEYELTLRGFSGQSYVVEASTNLVHWTAITTNVATMGAVILQDAASTNFSHRFYRAKVANHPN